MRQRSTALTALAAVSLTAALALGGCAPAATDNGGNGSGGAKASGGSSGSGGSGSGGSSASGGSSGTGGTPSGTGGSGSGTGGSASGTGGGGSGTGGSASGTGGSASGTGGSASGTGGSGSPDAGGTPDTASATPTFTALYTEVFGTMTCQGAACHSGAAPKDMIDFNDKMKAWTSLTAGNHEMELISRIKSTNAAMRMPKGKDPLPAATIKKIEDWVAAGAKND